MGESYGRSGPPMSVDGAVQKTSLMLAVTMACAAATWTQVRRAEGPRGKGKGARAAHVQLVSGVAQGRLMEGRVRAREHVWRWK